MLVLSVRQTMRGKLDKRDLLKQKLQKNWAMKNISLMLIICGGLGFPDGVFQERRVGWPGSRPSRSGADELPWILRRMKTPEVTDAASEVGLLSTGFGMVSQSGAGERKACSGMVG